MQSVRRLPILLLIVGLGLGACSPSNPPPPPTPSAAPAAKPSTTPASADPSPGPTPLAGLSADGLILPVVALPAGLRSASGPGFAPFSPRPVNAAANVQAEPLAPDLSNVILADLLSPAQREAIARNGFVVNPGTTQEFYELYERARYDNLPIFVSSDSLLHVYHLLFDKTLRRAEQQSFLPMLTSLDAALLRSSVAQYEALAGTTWAEAARRNAAYFAVALKLLDPTWELPEGLRDLAEPDLAAIEAHSGLGPSAIFPAYPRGEDWSQYVPRGHYTTSEELGRYFRAMMWHGRMTFRVDDETETRQAALLTQAFRQTLVEAMPAAELWTAIYEPTVFFVGRSDDLTPKEYGQALTTAYGEATTAQDLLDEQKFAAFRAAAEALRAPAIMGMVSVPGTPLEQTRGLRLMGQRFVPDAFVFQQLVDPQVPLRGMPSSLDFFAALGSANALQYALDAGATAYPEYLAQMEELRRSFASYSDEVWNQNLYWSWIHSLRPLLEPVETGYPQFMRSPAWQDKQLTTALGSWTELKRDTILYAKQVYVERGYDSLEPPEPERARGYVEPVPELFARVAALSRMTSAGLEQRGLLDEADAAALEAMALIAERLQGMAERELRGETLSEDDYEFIRFYGAELEGLTFAADDEGFYQGRGGSPAGGEPLQAAVVADIATNANEGVVLQNGVGRIFEIAVVAPIAGRLVLTRGGVFSHYEFTQPLGERLTDEDWRAMLDAGEAPPLAGWTSSYIVAQGGDAELATTIRRFNEALVQALWYTSSDPVSPFLGPTELADTQRYIDQLKAEGQFVGQKLLELELRSFDQVDAEQAVVTTRERWSDELYRGSPYFAEQAQGEPELIGVRPPYTLDVTYSMRRGPEGWQIEQIVLDPAAPPSWQTP